MFGIDLRSLALFRIALGGVILVDLAIRGVYFAAHYSDGGVLPRAEVPAHFAAAYSPYLHVASPVVLLGVFAVTLVAALAFTIGLRARLAAVVLWVLAASLDARNPLVLSNGDVLRNLLLLWSAMLPVDARFSVRSRSAEPRLQRVSRCFSVASAGLLVQVALVLLVTGLSKLAANAWTVEPVALEYALEMRGTPLGHQLLRLPDVLLRTATRGALAYEILAPMLLLLPFALPRATAAVLGIVLMTAIAATLNVGPLPLLTAAGLLAFLPSPAWDGPSSERVADPYARHASSVASATRVWTVRLLGAWVIATCAALAFGALPQISATPPVAFPRVAHALGLKQGWQMFVAMPQRIFWLDVAGEQLNGHVVDPRDLAAPPSRTLLEEPPSRSPRDYRWVRFEESLLGSERVGSRGPYVAYLCNRWNTRAEEAERLVSVSLRAAWAEPARLGLSGETGIVDLGQYPCGSVAPTLQ